MKRDRIFLNPENGTSPFEFNEEVAEVFDDMLQRSIPFYLEQQAMIRRLCKRLWIPGTTIYDLGCSTGTTLIGLGHELPDATRLVGCDNSLPMLARARKNVEDNSLQQRIELRQDDLNSDPSVHALKNAGLVILCWTLQFVQPLKRDRLIRSIYDALADQGALIVTEKILPDSGNLNGLFVDEYHEFKRRRGYGHAEIARKREALENVLIPYRLEENLDLFQRNGFELVETFFQWFNFAGFLCIKKPATTSP